MATMAAAVRVACVWGESSSSRRRLLLEVGVDSCDWRAQLERVDRGGVAVQALSAYDPPLTACFAAATADAMVDRASDAEANASGDHGGRPTIDSELVLVLTWDTMWGTNGVGGSACITASGNTWCDAADGKG